MAVSRFWASCQTKYEIVYAVVFIRPFLTKFLSKLSQNSNDISLAYYLSITPKFSYPSYTSYYETNAHPNTDHLWHLAYCHRIIKR